MCLHPFSCVCYFLCWFLLFNPFVSLIFFPFCCPFYPPAIQALADEIESHAADVSRALGVGQSLSSLSCAAERRLLAEKLESLQSRYSEVQDRCCRKAALLDQALSNARLFGEEEVEVLNWLAEVEDKLSLVSVKDYKRDVLQKQHADQLVFSVFLPSFYVVYFVAFVWFYFSSPPSFHSAKLIRPLVLFLAWRSVKRFHVFQRNNNRGPKKWVSRGKLQMIHLLCEQCLSKLGHPVPLESWMLLPRTRASNARWVFRARLATEEAVCFRCPGPCALLKTGR